jgi:hypothetical protein
VVPQERDDGALERFPGGVLRGGGHRPRYITRE